MKILVTGFDPFGGESVNPASEAVLRLPETIENAAVIPLILPTVFHKSLKVIEHAINEHDPDLIVSIGQAGGRKEITVERIGINVDDARIADNDGKVVIDEPVISGGPAAYFATLPIKAMVKAIQDAGIPAAISNTAGTFVCNHVMYGVLHLCHTKFPEKRAGFIHIPFLPVQTLDKPEYSSMELDVIVQGLICALRAAVIYEKDLQLTGGKEH